MNNLRKGVIASSALAVIAGFLMQERDITRDAVERSAPTVTPESAMVVGTSEIPAADDWRLMTPSGVSPGSEFLPESDTTGLLQESLSIDELLDEVNADSGDGFTLVDREQFAALLRSDPELRKAIAD